MSLTAKQLTESIASYSNALVEKKLSFVPQVCRIEKELFNSTFSVNSTNSKTPSSAISPTSSTYYTFWMTSQNGELVLSEDATKYDRLEIDISIERDYVKFTEETLVYDIDKLVKDTYYQNGAGLSFFSLVVATTNYISFGIGLDNNKTMRIGWVSIPTNFSTTITKIRGVKYVNPFNYSTDEQMVGYWIDGKPIYQITRILTAPTLIKNSEVNVFTDLAGLNVSQVVGFDGRVLSNVDDWTFAVNINYSSEGDCVIAPFWFKQGATNYFYVTMKATTDNAIKNYTNAQIIIHIRYTKIADA